jgi:hypothetical protein
MNEKKLTGVVFTKLILINCSNCSRKLSPKYFKVNCRQIALDKIVQIPLIIMYCTKCEIGHMSEDLREFSDEFGLIYHVCSIYEMVIETSQIKVNTKKTRNVQHRKATQSFVKPNMEVSKRSQYNSSGILLLSDMRARDMNW